MPSINDLSADSAHAMTLEDFQAIAAQEMAPAAPPEHPEAPEGEAGDPAEPPSAEPAPSEEPPEEPAAQRRGNPDVPLRQERERRRQLEAALQDPRFLAQQLQQLGYQVGPAEQEQPPSVLDDEAAAIQYYIQQHIAPLQAEVQQLRQEREMLRHEQMMAQVRQQFGGLGDVDSHIAQFDADLPEYASLPPALKLLAIQGHQAMNPSNQQNSQAAIQAEAQRLAEAKVAEILKSQGGKGAAPPTLGSLPPAQNPEAMDMSSMSPRDFGGLSLAQMEAIAKRERG